MRMKKSHLKEAVKSVVRECLNERAKQQEGCGSKFKRMAKHVADSEKDAGKSPAVAKKIGYATANKAKTDEAVKMPNKGQFKRVAKHAYTVTDEDKARNIQSDPDVNESARPTLPPNKAQYKTVAPHSYTTTDENEPLTIQSDPKVNEAEEQDEGADSQITMLDDIVKHVIAKVPALKNNPEKIGRVADLLFQHQFGGRPADPEALQQAVQRALPAVQTDMNKGSEQDECGSMEEAGLTSEEPNGEESPMNEPQPFAGAEPVGEPSGEEGHEYDERMEIKLIKLMKLCATKLEKMHAGMPGADAPVSLPPDGEEPNSDPTGEPTEEPHAEEPGEEPHEEPHAEEPGEEPHEEPAAEEEPEVPFKKEEKPKKKKEKAKDDPTEFTKKLAKENHKVQARSFSTVNDMASKPKNVRDPKVPGP